MLDYLDQERNDTGDAGCSDEGRVGGGLRRSSIEQGFGDTEKPENLADAGLAL